MHIRAAFAVTLALALAGCVSDDGATSGEATRKQIRERIEQFSVLRGKEFADNVGILSGILKESAFEQVVDALDSHSDPKVRAGCAMVLGIGQDGRAREPLADSIEDDDDPGVRYTAAYSLLLFRDARGLPPLFEALRGSDPINRDIANRRLMEVTRKDFGFIANDPPETRNAAADRWEAWYRNLGDEVVLQLVAPRGRP
jgi:HEAT repeat protein